MASNNISNPYAESLERDFYMRCPKAVFAALAVSFAGNPSEATEKFIEEWRALHKKGIIPQKPYERRYEEINLENTEDEQDERD